VPVPRRFDRRLPERDTTRTNERIRVPEVRLIDENGEQVGVMRTDEALRYAQERDLDLVEVAPEARPPVCRVLDYSKYKYEQAQKVKQARKHQQQITIREIKFRPKIAEHDYSTKKGHVERFLRHKDKVKITIMFRGREVTHPERGVMILDRLAEELAELAIVEQRPLQDGRNMTMMLGPSKAVLSGEINNAPADEAGEVADPDAAARPAAEGAASAVEAPEPAAAVPAAEAAEPAAAEPAAEAAEPAAAVPAAEAAEPAAAVPAAEAAEPAAAEPAAAEPAPKAPKAAKPAPKAPKAAKPAAESTADGDEPPAS
jgi:translation initiation factor IF-3